jgi:hypothetical protein
VLIVAAIGAQDADDVVPESLSLVQEDDAKVHPFAKMDALLNEVAHPKKAPKGVLNWKKNCWTGCKKKQGCGCSFCGSAGICCRKGWKDKSNGCDGLVGGKHKHVCVTAPKGICAKYSKPKKYISKSTIAKNFFGTKKRGKPIKFARTLTAKTADAYLKLKKYVDRATAASLRAKGVMAMYECKQPAKNQITIYEVWASVKAQAALDNNWQNNKLVRLLKGQSATKLSGFPRKVKFCKAFAPKLAGNLTNIRKNSDALKAYSVLVADRVQDILAAHKGVLLELLKRMGRKTKMSPMDQYAYVLLYLKHKYGTVSGGISSYVLDHISKAMNGKHGLLEVSTIAGHTGNWVHFVPKDLGLSGSMELASRLSVRVSDFTAEMANVDDKAVGVSLRKKKLSQDLPAKDYNAVFKASCEGQDPNCAKLSEAKCTPKSGCKWVSGWNGN